MQPDDLRHLLESVAAGRLGVDEGLRHLSALNCADLGFAQVDHQRLERCGLPEVVFAEGKTPDQVLAILESLHERHGRALATRVQPDALDAVEARIPGASLDRLARTVFLGSPPQPAPGTGPVLVVAAGTSDLPVAEEAAVTAAFAGCSVERLYDVGVAGIHRLLSRIDRLRRASVLIVVAGMEGALPSVVGGLVRAPVIGVPTSVGYGASFGGLAALLGMLNACASGLSVVNIDNGFGAGVSAARILQMRPAPDEENA